LRQVVRIMGEEGLPEEQLLSPIKWQDTHTAGAFIHDHQCPRLKVRLILAYDIKNSFSHVVRKYILGANLNDAWTLGSGESQRGAEIQVVRKNDVTVGSCPFHNPLVSCVWGTDGRPVDCLPAFTLE
jgi:hypothetical protein